MTDVAFGVLAVALTGLLALRLISSLREVASLPLWDGAARGLAVIQTARAAGDLDLLRFIKTIHGMGVWPPTFPLLTFPIVLALGPGFEVLRGIQVGWFVLGSAALYLSALESLPRMSYLLGFMAVVLYATSPQCQLFGTLLYLEIPGLTLQMLAIALYLRSRRVHSPQAARQAAVALVALFFLKYNYGVLLLIPLLLLEISEIPDKPAILRSQQQRWRQWSRGTRTGWVLVLLYGAFLVVLVETGGWQFTFAGRPVGLHSAGNPAYLLLLLLAVRFLLQPRTLTKHLRSWRRRLSLRHRALLDLLVIPMVIWFLLPPHLKEFFGFLQNRSSGMATWSLENLLWYPRAFVTEYSTSAGLGIAVLVLASVGLSLAWRRGADRGVRLLALTLAVGLVASWLHPYKATRFFMSVAPLLWLMAGTTIAQCLSWFHERVGARRRLGVAVLLFVVSLVGSGLLVRRGIDERRFRQSFESYTVPASNREVLNRIAQLSIEESPTVLLGTWNRFSPALVEWSTRLLAPHTATSTFARPLGADLRPLDPHHALNLLCENVDLRQLLVLTWERPERWAQEYEREIGWENRMRQALSHSTRFERIFEESFPASGYRLDCYRRQVESMQP